MKKISLFLLVLLVANGISWADGDGNYYNYSDYSNTNYNVNTTQYTTPSTPTTTYYNPFLNMYSNQVAMNTYNNAMATKNAIAQLMPVIDYSNANLPNQATYTAIDYQQLRINALKQEADLQNYSLQQMKKNDEMLRKNSWENNNAPAYTEQSPQEYKYNPAYNPSLGEK